MSIEDDLRALAAKVAALRSQTTRPTNTLADALADEIKAAVAAAFADQWENLRTVLREELARASAVGDPDELWNAEQVGKALGKSPAAIRCAHERGTLGIETVRLGKRTLRWRAGDVRALASQRIEGAKRRA